MGYGLTGELHFIDEDSMVLSVPGTDASMTYDRVDDMVACY